MRSFETRDGGEKMMKGPENGRQREEKVRRKDDGRERMRRE